MVIQFDPVARARELAEGWRVQPFHVLAARAEALRAMQANGVRLPRDIYDAWLCMSAVVIVGKARGDIERAR